MTDRDLRVLHVDDDADFMEMAAEFRERAADAITVEMATAARE